MTDKQIKELACELSGLAVFRGVLKKAPMAALVSYLACEGSVRERLSRYGEFVASLAEEDFCFSDFLSRAVFEDENRYIVRAAGGEAVSAVLEANALAELELFSRLTRLNAQTLCGYMGFQGHIPQFENHPIDFDAAYGTRLQDIGRYGYGVFAGARMFRVDNDVIIPVEAADDVSLDSFVGYESERQKVIDNTRALIEGRPAANVLLFGDAGTGKSSTVKACVNHFCDQGLRLIELRKDQLFSLSHVMDRIAGNPLKFIIFIDDLSFNKNDDCFSMLKAALEGSASSKAKNAVIYATSNRRHIVKETFSDRSANDDVHTNDTVQELMSLSDRFGLTVYFSKPNKQLYLQIVHELAENAGLKMDKQQLDVKAEAYALGKGSRSPRAAQQFVANLTQEKP